MRTLADVRKFYTDWAGLGESPPGSNHNFITTWFGVGDVSWCVETFSMAVCTGFGDLDHWPIKTVAPDYDKGFAYVWGAADAFDKVGLFDRQVRVGSGVAFNWNGVGGVRNTNSHFGWVDEILGDGTVMVYEGNHQDQLQLVRRSMQWIEGFCHVPYEDDNQEDDVSEASDAIMAKLVYLDQRIGDAAKADSDTTRNDLAEIVTKVMDEVREDQRVLATKLDQIIAKLG